MSRQPHLFVALSGHGFGHLAQTAPVLNALRQRLPTLRLTVQSSLPNTVLRNRINGEIEHIAEATDFGMIMADALTVEVTASIVAYRAFHADWKNRLAQQEALLTRLKPTLVLANIPYLPLTAASRLGIPAVALCSLNWAVILEAYCPARANLVAVLDTIVEAYNKAATFLRPAPSMPMPTLGNIRSIGPIANIGQDRRIELNARLGLAGNETLVLVGLGGIDFRLPMERWPTLPGVRWLIPATWKVNHPDTFYLERVADVPFIDLLRSGDVLLTKSGYGSFTEAVCNGTAVLYVKRSDWPEEPGLSDWLTEHGNALPIDRRVLEAGTLLDSLQALLAQPQRSALEPTGIAEAVAYLMHHWL
jgi:hypothetical protein